MSTLNYEDNLGIEEYPKWEYAPDVSGVHEAAPALAQALTHIRLEDMQYDGTFGEVVSTIERSLEWRDDAPAVLSVARLIRSLLDTKADTAYTGVTFEGVRAVTKFALSVFDGTTTPATIYDLLSDNPGSRLAFDTPVHQTKDITTFDSTSLEKITDAAARLAELVGKEDVLFLSLCHGGLIAGAGTFMTREQARPQGDSLFYPVRFSRYKHGDAAPMLSHDEVQRLRSESVGRALVVFDEDMCSGNTLEYAQEHFARLFGRPVAVLTTNNLRDKFALYAKSRKNYDEFKLHESYKQYQYEIDTSSPYNSLFMTEGKLINSPHHLSNPENDSIKPKYLPLNETMPEESNNWKDDSDYIINVKPDNSYKL
ncbi:MAG: hypothetical protein JWM81_33 [Candidatus Saccharibacteria bacterium]|nr:hypothetical protein [Candidatus Saccharibacteria bacterium]